MAQTLMGNEQELQDPGRADYVPKGKKKKVRNRESAQEEAYGIDLSMHEGLKTEQRCG
jgi:hypothetical protein